jgi:hypothetical protein
MILEQKKKYRIDGGYGPFLTTSGPASALDSGA